MIRAAIGGLLFATAVASVLTFAVGRTAAPPVVAAEPTSPKIEETYREIALSVLRQSAEEPRVISTEKIVPTVIPTAEVAKPVKARVVEQKAESNVCTRHNRKKVWISERKWRCRKV